MLENWEEVEQAIIDETGSNPRIRGDEHIFDCPFCNKPGHFYVNYEKGVYNCYVCGGDVPEGSGKIEKLARLMGVTPDTDDVSLADGVSVEQIDQDMAAIYLAGAGVVDAVPLYERNEAPIAPPDQFEFITDGNWMQPRVQRIAGYLYSRGLTVDHIRFYHLGVSVMYHFDQVVFPDFNRNGQLRWWQKRSIDPEARGPKYIGPAGDKAGKIGNWYQAIAQPTWYLGVAEGPVSGMIAGPEFAWLWGKEHSPEQLDTLLTVDKPIVIAMDGEAKAFKNAIGLATDIRSRGGQSIIVPIPGEHDPASLGHWGFQEILLKSLMRRDSSDLDFLERVVNDYV